ncbi:MAG TPA: hypothetical protein VKU83_00860, partial [Puia sp.]|nr:hypothetical protein [Puia sp.]
MKYGSIILLTGLLAATGLRVQGQEEPPPGSASGFALTLQLPQNIVDFNVDNLGNIYVINRDNQLKKLSPRGDSLAVFNDVIRYGKVASIDVTNPLKILVYYRDF